MKNTILQGGDFSWTGNDAIKPNPSVELSMAPVGKKIFQCKVLLVRNVLIVIKRDFVLMISFAHRTWREPRECVDGVYWSTQFGHHVEGD